MFKGKVDVNVFLTMNAGKEHYDEVYCKRMEEYFAPFRFLNGSVQIVPVCDTLQVQNYSKFAMAGFSEEHKKAVHEAEFPLALEKAFRIGVSS